MIYTNNVLSERLHFTLSMTHGLQSLHPSLGYIKQSSGVSEWTGGVWCWLGAKMSAKISPSPPLYTKLLVYCALQVAFISFLFSYYGVEMGPVVRPAFKWIAGKADEIPLVKNTLVWLRTQISSENANEESVKLPKKLTPKPKEANSEVHPLNADLSYLPVFSE
ncbi:unnamed protein product [Toxocara canis]|uniref:ABC2_membrane domain-containing protein n=1 Tax=Toxocara canis TaxID=6265 RepID=A0A183U0J7_TOXCA|nr:unnamed protein product [Toxocara canis]